MMEIENITIAERLIRLVAAVALPVSIVVDPLSPQFAVVFNVIAMYLFVTALTGVDLVYAVLNYIVAKLVPSLYVDVYSLR